MLQKRSRRACTWCSGTGEHQDKNGAETSSRLQVLQQLQHQQFAAVRLDGEADCTVLEQQAQQSPPAVLSGREPKIHAMEQQFFQVNGRQHLQHSSKQWQTCPVCGSPVASASGRADAADRFGTAKFPAVPENSRKRLCSDCRAIRAS